MSKPLRILHYTAGYAPAWSLGGPPRSTSNLCEGLASRGHTVFVFTTKLGLADRTDLPDGAPVSRNGVTVHYFPLSRGPGIRSVSMESAARARIQEFDLVHVTGVWQPTSIAACRVARSAGIRYVISPRGALSHYSFSQKFLKKAVYWWLFERTNLNGAAVIHYTAKAERTECARLGLRPPNVIVPNSVDLASWRPDPEGALRWRRRHGLGDDEFVFLNSGRLHHKKGLELLMHAAAALPRDVRWRLVFAGPDEDGTGQFLANAARDSGLVDRLHFTGSLDTKELAAVYSAAGLFLFPSRNENFGNVAIEALACGTRLAVSPGVGCSDEVKSLEGVAVLERAVGPWTNEMNRALIQPPLVRESVDRRRRLLEARYQVDAVAAAMEVAYRNILAKT